MLRNVYLEGELGERYGKHLRVEASTMQDVFKCLNGNFSDFRKYLIECHEKDIGFMCHVDGRNLNTGKEILLKFPKGDMIISPQPAGSKSGVGKIFAAIAAAVIIYYTGGFAANSAVAAGGTGTGGGWAVSAGGAISAPGTAAISATAGLALSGVQQIMMPDPSLDNDQDSSYLFQGSSHNLLEGDPVPLLYGELRIPGRPVSALIRNQTLYFYNTPGSTSSTRTVTPSPTGAINPGESCGGDGNNTAPDPSPEDPNAVEDTFNCAYQSSISENVLTNDIGTGLTVVENTAPSNGSLSASVSSAGAFTYTPNNGFVGDDSFQYTVQNSAGNTNGARVVISVASPGSITTASDSFTAEFESQISGNVLQNDSHSGGLTITVVDNTEPSSGVLEIVTSGFFTYTPNNEFSGTDSFQYTVQDTLGQTKTETVTITVLGSGTTAPTNTPPVANVDVNLNVPYGQGVFGNVLTNDTDADGDNLTARLVTLPERGTITLSSNGAYQYNPNPPGFEGTDSCIYAVSDGTAESQNFITFNYDAEVTLTPEPAPEPAPEPEPDYPPDAPGPGITPEIGGT